MQANCKQDLFSLYLKCRGALLITIIYYIDSANNDGNSRFSDEGGVCSAVGLSEPGSRPGPGGAFHRHGAFFLLLFSMNMVCFFLVFFRGHGLFFFCCFFSWTW